MMKSKISVEANHISRRRFLEFAGAGAATLSFPPAFALSASTGIQTVTSAAASNSKNAKFVWVLLRGALDSLHTIIPTSDPHYSALRPNLSKSFEAPLLSLSDDFALHPALKNMHALYQNKSLIPIVATSSGYQSRSHFDGQDFIESGLVDTDPDTGWLARAIDAKKTQAMAVSNTTPISLRSSENVDTWFPSNLKNAETDLYEALVNLYQDDEMLSEALIEGLAVRDIVGEKSTTKKQRGSFVNLSKACAKFMREEPLIDCAMLEMSGWDTHNRQANRLAKGLSSLDEGLAALKEGLGETWNDTVVVVATEFGRTAKENGTGGTDHGTASAMFLAGGAVNGGKVLGKWPGLAETALYQGRDLAATSNSFAWISTMLQQHWGLTQSQLTSVFPHINAYSDVLITG